MIAPRHVIITDAIPPRCIKIILCFTLCISSATCLPGVNTQAHLLSLIDYILSSQVKINNVTTDIAKL